MRVETKKRLDELRTEKLEQFFLKRPRRRRKGLNGLPWRSWLEPVFVQ